MHLAMKELEVPGPISGKNGSKHDVGTLPAHFGAKRDCWLVPDDLRSPQTTRIVLSNIFLSYALILKDLGV